MAAGHQFLHRLDQYEPRRVRYLRCGRLFRLAPDRFHQGKKLVFGGVIRKAKGCKQALQQVFVFVHGILLSRQRVQLQVGFVDQSGPFQAGDDVARLGVIE